LADSLTNSNGAKTETRIIEHDFSKDFTSEAFKKLWDEKIGNLTDDVAVLINNAGTPGGQYIEKMTEAEIHKLMTVNVYTTTMFSKEFVRHMKKRYEDSKKSGRPRRAFIGSTSAMTAAGASEYLQVYSASKHYINFLTEGLQYELSDFCDVACW